MIAVGFARETVEVPLGTPMAGFAARIGGSTGTLDPITVRAVVLGDAAFVAADVCALHEDTCRAVRQAVAEVVTSCTVTATHTHSGPCSAKGRLGPALEEIEDELRRSAVLAVHRAVQGATDCTVEIRTARGTGIAFDRRRGLPADPPITVLTARRPDGSVQGSIAHFACHPVVIDGSSTLLSGDYPAALREELEREGGIAVFLTGCAGDINTGHSPEASYAPGADEARTPAEARRVGRTLVRAVDQVPAHVLELELLGHTARETALPIDAPAPARVTADRQAWCREHASAGPGRQALLGAWISWADEVLAAAGDSGPDASWAARVGVLHLGTLLIVTLPGEPFLVTAERIEARISAAGFEGTVLVLGYADGVPGYLPPREAYRDGGYEVTDAHRYYAMPGPFAPGAAELLERAALEAAASTGVFCSPSPSAHTRS